MLIEIFINDTTSFLCSLIRFSRLFFVSEMAHLVNIVMDSPNYFSVFFVAVTTVDCYSFRTPRIGRSWKVAPLLTTQVEEGDRDEKCDTPSYAA